MSELNANKECILDYFGKCVIEEVYDRALYGAKRTLELTTKNSIVLEKYSIFSELTQEQKKEIVWTYNRNNRGYYLSFFGNDWRTWWWIQNHRRVR